MNKRRKILAAMLAAFMLLVPMVSTAQIDIKGGDEETSDLSGTWGTMQITDNETGDYVPLGEGLWLLAGAAGLYLLVKSRKTRKATAVAAAALALTLGTTQCKKTEESVIPAGETISISFMAGNGAKADIDVYTGRITWEKDDKVYVVCNNANYAPSKDNKAVLLGDNLTAKTENSQQSEISGEVTVPEGYNLPSSPSFTFYYVGSGVTFDKTNFTFDIQNQNGINAGHYMVGRTEAVEMKKDQTSGKYVPKVEGAKHFDPLTSVLRLNTSEFGANKTMTMGGGNSEMTIDLTNPETPSYTAGSITFTSGEDVRISVIPTTTPGENENVTLSFSGNGKVGSITVTNGIKAGRIYSKVINNAGYPIHVEAIGSDVLKGKFTINSNGDQVYFSKGNLRYYDSNNDGTCEFMFEEKQWVYRKSYSKTDCGHFLWSKDKDVAVAKSYSDPEHAIGDVFFTNKEETTPNPEFHVNGETGVNAWRVLSSSEWQYLLGIDAVASFRENAQSLYAYKTLSDGNGNDVKGLVILPDGTDPSVMSDITTTSKLSDYDAVFIPDAGNRTTGTIQAPMGYWTSTCSTTNKDRAINLRKNNNAIEATYNGYRSFGNAVRLVTKAVHTN